MIWRKSSAAIFYETLERQLKDSGQLSRHELLPPSVEGLLRHFRLNTFLSGDTDITAILQKAASALIAEEGLALQRRLSQPSVSRRFLCERYAR